MIACLLAAGLWLAGCGGEAEQTVVVYTSVDPPFARQVFAEFEKETGIRVKPLFDPESNKTMGLVQQLLREKDRPRADVWWSGEWFGSPSARRPTYAVKWRWSIHSRPRPPAP